MLVFTSNPSSMYNSLEWRCILYDKTNSVLNLSGQVYCARGCRWGCNISREGRETTKRQSSVHGLSEYYTFIIIGRAYYGILSEFWLTDRFQSFKRFDWFR